jgi:hypothetical protein
MKTGYIIAIFVLIIFILTVMFFPEKYGLTSSANGMFMQETDSSGNIELTYGGSDSFGGLRLLILINGIECYNIISSESSSLMALPANNNINSPKIPPGGIIYDTHGKPFLFDYYVGKFSIPGYNAPISDISYGIITDRKLLGFNLVMGMRPEDVTVGLALGIGSRNTSFVGQMGITKIAINYSFGKYRERENCFINFNHIPSFCTANNISFQSKLLSLPDLLLAGFIIKDHIPWVIKVSSDRESVQYAIIDIGYRADQIYSAINTPIKISGDVGSVTLSYDYLPSHDGSYINYGNPTISNPGVVTALLRMANMSKHCIVIDYDNSMFTMYK